MVIVNNLNDLIKYWRSGNGGEVYVGNQLINEMKRHLLDIFKNDIIPIIRNKIKQSRNNRTYHIRSEYGSRRGCWCTSLGSFSVNIEYDYSFNPQTTYHNIEFHLHGYDDWDFEYKKGHDLKTILHNIFEEYVPSKIAGKGKVFQVKYDFHWNLDFNEKPNLFENYSKDILYNY